MLITINQIRLRSYIHRYQIRLTIQKIRLTFLIKTKNVIIYRLTTRHSCRSKQIIPNHLKISQISQWCPHLTKCLTKKTKRIQRLKRNLLTLQIIWREIKQLQKRPYETSITHFNSRTNNWYFIIRHFGIEIIARTIWRSVQHCEFIGSKI